MQPKPAQDLIEPRHKKLGALAVVGMSRHYQFDKVGEISQQWQSFVPLIASIAANGAVDTFGVIYNGGESSFDYLTGVELRLGQSIPVNLVRLDIAAQEYLVFSHPGHVASLRATCDAIWSAWLPASPYQVVEAPWFERYGAQFDPQTGAGGLDVWIPIRCDA